MIMWPIVVAPADMQAHALWWDVLDSQVKRSDVDLDDLLEFAHRLILERKRALHRQIRSIQLQHETLRVDILVFLFHLLGDREHVTLMRIVVGIQHGCTNDAGRSRSHKTFGKLLRRLVQTMTKEGALVLHPAQIFVLDLGDCLRSVEDLGSHHAPRLQHPGIGGKLAHVLRSWSLPFATKPAHALWDVSLKSDPRLFAVIADIDAGPQLFLNHVPNGYLR